MAINWPADLDNWDELISVLPGAHVLQTRAWAQVKAAYGWQPHPMLWRDQSGLVRAAALVLEREVSPLRLRVIYVPRGPLLDWSDADWRQRVLTDLVTHTRQRGAIFIKIDPEVVTGCGIPGEESAVDSSEGAEAAAALSGLGWRPSEEQVQFRNTVLIDLKPAEDELLARMKQKTRYNIRLAEKKGVQVRCGTVADLPMLYQMYAETSVRDGFVIRSQDYYQTVWRTFIEENLATPLLAEVNGEPVAALVLFHFAGRAWYLYGMSRDAHREKMPNYLLQWEAMRQARALGCQNYDLWGAPEIFNESDALWGVYRFKEGLGGIVIRTPGAWDYPTRTWLYNGYTRYLPRLLAFLRRRGQERTKREVSL